MSDTTVRGGRSSSSQKVIIDGRDVTPRNNNKGNQPSNNTACTNLLGTQFKQPKFAGDNFPPIITGGLSSTEGSLSSPSNLFESPLKRGSLDCEADETPLNDKDRLCLTASAQTFQLVSTINKFRTIIDPTVQAACMSISDAQVTQIYQACGGKPHIKKQGSAAVTLSDGVTGYPIASDFEACVRDNLGKLPRKQPQPKGKQ